MKGCKSFLGVYDCRDKDLFLSRSFEVYSIQNKNENLSNEYMKVLNLATLKAIITAKIMQLKNELDDIQFELLSEKLVGLAKQ